jgi:RNA-directed DNA polymerase
MMHGLEKSDPVVVAMKPANNADSSAAEWVEPRTGTKGNADQPRTRRTQSRGSVSPGLERVRQAARQRKKEKFTALLHHISVDLLRDAFLALKRRAAPGVDGITWQDYEANLEGNLQELHRSVHRGSYRAMPVKRKFIPKPDGKQRPLGITALEDKIIQRAVVTVLTEIYEEDFLGFSYGFRPGRGQHDALDALCVGIGAARVNWILDADIRSFFDRIDQQWLVRFLEHRIGDERILRLIRKWLQAGVLDDGAWSVAETGTPQGAVVSPLLANVYLHYVFDLWAEQWRRREAKGKTIFVRYADDLIAGFEYEADARRFWDAMRERFERFGLELHGDKTRLLEFGRYAAERRQRRGQGATGDVPVPGLHLHLRPQAQRGFQLQRRTRGDRMRNRLQEIKANCEGICTRRWSSRAPGWPRCCVATMPITRCLPTLRSLAQFRYRVAATWRRLLSRRSQKSRVNWERMTQIADEWLPQPRVLHPWPDQRFAVKHPRWEPNA